MGDKTQLDGVSKKGQTGICKVLIVGAMSRIRSAVRKGILPDGWLGRFVARKSRMIAAVAAGQQTASNFMGHDDPPRRRLTSASAVLLCGLL